MGVKGRFSIVCSGPCAARDRQGHGRLLGRVEMTEDGEATWDLATGTRFRITIGPEGTSVVPAKGKMLWRVDAGADKANWQVEPGHDDYRVTCDRCGRAWVFTVDELTARYDELAGRPSPVGVAGVDVGSPVGSSGAR